MRSVQTIDQSSGSTTRANHVIGVDESGNVTGPGGFALAVVRCPRTRGERLAELLVQNDLSPWLAKSKSLADKVSEQERARRVEGLIADLQEEGIPWYVAVGYNQQTIHHKAAGICNLAKKTITQVEDYQGDAVLLPDGSASMYGNSQEHLRVQAAQTLGGSFQSAFGEVYVTGFPKADLTYPEVSAADYLAGHIRRRLCEGEQPHTCYDNVVWFDRNWREPKISPLPFYRIRGLSGQYGGVEQTRVAAWIKGRHADGDRHDVASQWENTIDMLESTELQEYLLDTLSP